MSLSKIKNLIQKLLSPDTWSVDAGILLLRMSCALMLLHGWSKFTNFSEDSLDWPDPLHVGSTVSCALTVFAELFCTLFVAIGLFSHHLIACMHTLSNQYNHTTYLSAFLSTQFCPHTYTL